MPSTKRVQLVDQSAVKRQKLATHDDSTQAVVPAEEDASTRRDDGGIDEDEWAKFQAEVGDLDESRTTTIQEEVVEEEEVIDDEEEQVASGIVVQAMATIHNRALTHTKDTDATRTADLNHETLTDLRKKNQARDKVMEEDAYDDIGHEMEVQQELDDRVGRIKELREKARDKKKTDGEEITRLERSKKENKEEDSDQSSDSSEDIEEDVLWRKRGL